MNGLCHQRQNNKERLCLQTASTVRIKSLPVLTLQMVQETILSVDTCPHEASTEAIVSLCVAIFVVY